MNRRSGSIDTIAAWLEEVLVEEDFMLMEWRKLASAHARGVQRPSNMD